jgi:hypothetical protein
VEELSLRPGPENRVGEREGFEGSVAGAVGPAVVCWREDEGEDVEENLGREGKEGRGY